MAHTQDNLGPSKAGQPGNIEKFIITSDYTDDLDISMGIVELHYYESVLETTVRITAQVVDSSLRKASTQGKTGYEGSTENDESAEAPGDDATTVSGGEKVVVSFSDNQGGNVALENLRVQATRNQIDNSKASVYILDVYSDEALRNSFETTRLVKRYQGKISDSVREILENNLQSRNFLDIDQTLNELTFNGDTHKPFYKVVTLAKKSVPEGSELGGTAGYFFFETAGAGEKTYCFKGVDNLMKEAPAATLTAGDTPAATIKQYEFLSNTNVDEKVQNGAFSSSQMRTMNLSNEEYESNDNSSSNVESASEMGGTEHPKIASDLDLPNQVTRISSVTPDNGVLPKGYGIEEQLERAKEVDFDVTQIERQATQRYNQLFTYKLNVTILGNFNLRAGMTVEVDFPQGEWKTDASNSSLKGGKYLIVDLCHILTTENTYTKLNLVRESLFK